MSEAGSSDAPAHDAAPGTKTVRMPCCTDTVTGDEADLVADAEPDERGQRGVVQWPAGTVERDAGARPVHGEHRERGADREVELGRAGAVDDAQLVAAPPRFQSRHRGERRGARARRWRRWRGRAGRRARRRGGCGRAGTTRRGPRPARCRSLPCRSGGAGAERARTPRPGPSPRSSRGRRPGRRARGRRPWRGRARRRRRSARHRSGMAATARRSSAAAPVMTTTVAVIGAPRR